MRTYFRGLEERTLKALRERGPAVLGNLAGLSRRKAEERLSRQKADGINPAKRDEARILRDLSQPAHAASLVDGGQDASRSAGASVAFVLGGPEERWLGDRLDMFSREVAGTTFDEIDKILRAGFAEGQPLPVIADTLRQKFETFDKYRAPLIARTEAMSALNQGSIFGVRQAGVADRLRKVWLTAADEWVRPDHMQAGMAYARGIPVEDLFLVGQDKMIAPGNGKDPAQNINCRCTVAYVKKAKPGPAAPPEPGPAPPLPPKPVPKPRRRPVPKPPPSPGGLAIGDDLYNSTVGKRLARIEPLEAGRQYTVEELEKALYDRVQKHPILKDNLMIDFKAHNMDPLTLRRTIDAWIELVNEFPEIAANFDYLGCGLQDKLARNSIELWKRKGYERAAAAANYHKIQFNPKYYSYQTEADFASDWSRCFKNGFHPESGVKEVLESIVQHEFGHNIEFAMEGTYGTFAHEMYKVSSEMRKRLTAAGKVRGEWQRYWKDNKFQVQAIAKYGFENELEGFAECFQDWWIRRKYNMPMSEPTKKVGEIVERVFRIWRFGK
jgi:hypothetical protein